MGSPVASIGPILDVTQFDAWGRRTFSMLTNRGRTDVIQGLTTVTPLWSQLKSLQRAEALYSVGHADRDQFDSPATC